MLSIESAYQNLLATVLLRQRQFQRHPLIAYKPLTAVARPIDTLYVGRAINGWHHEFSFADLKQDPALHLEAILSQSQLVMRSTDVDNWAEVYWNQGSLGYNTKDSIFWAYIQAISKHYYTAGVNWFDAIAWTNVHKIAIAGRYPTSQMVKYMEGDAHALLLAEIAYYQPKNIVCLSGLADAARLLASARATQHVPASTDAVEYVGDVCWEDDRAVRLVIGAYPRRGGERRLGEVIARLLV